MKNRWLKTILSLMLAIAMILPGLAYADKEYHVGETVPVEIPGDYLVPDVYTEASKDIEKILNEFGATATSDSDINFSDSELLYFTDTEVPIKVVTQGEIEQVYSNEDIIQWAQKLKLSSDTIKRLWEEYGRGALPPEFVNDVKSGWETLATKYKDFYSKFGLTETDIEKLVKQARGSLEETVPELPALMDDEVTVTSRTDLQAEVDKTLGQIRDEERAILAAWAASLYNKAKKIMGAKVPAGTQVYADSDLYDPEKVTSFNNNYSLLSNVGDANAPAMLEMVYEMVEATGNGDQDPLSVPVLDEKGHPVLDENGNQTYKTVDRSKLSIQDASAMSLFIYESIMKAQNPEMSIEDIRATATYKQLQEVATDEGKARVLLDELGAGSNQGFATPEMKAALNAKNQAELEKQLERAKAMLDPNNPAVTTETNTAVWVFADTSSGENAFSSNNLDATANTREKIKVIQAGYMKEAAQIEGNLPMGGQTPEQMLETICTDLQENCSAGPIFSSSAIGNCYAVDDTWSSHPMGNYYGLGTEDADIADPADLFVMGLKDHPELFDSNGRFIDTPENSKVVSEIYQQSVSMITGRNMNFRDSDYVVPISSGAFTTTGNGVVTAEASARMEKEITETVAALESVGIKMDNVRTKTGYYIANGTETGTGIIDLSDPKEAEAYRECLRNTDRMHWQNEGQVAAYGVDLVKLEENIRYYYDLYGVDPSHTDAICASIEMQRELSGSDYANINTSYGNYTGTKVSESLTNSMVDVDPLLYLIMDEDLPTTLTKEVPLGSPISPTDLPSEGEAPDFGTVTTTETVGVSQSDLKKSFLTDYITEENGFIPASVFMTDANKHIWYEMNPEIYGKETGGLFSQESSVGIFGEIARYVSGFEVENTVTGQIEHIQGATDNNGYIGFCAASNGYIYMQDANGNWGFMKKEDYLNNAVKKCATDHGVDPALIGNVYVYVDDNGKQCIGVEYDVGSMILGAGNPIPLDKLKELMGEYKKKLKDLAEADGVGDDMIDWSGLGDIMDNFDPTKMDDWRDWVKDYLKELGYDFTDEEIDAIIEIIRQVLTDPDLQDALDPRDKEDDSGEDKDDNEEKESWTWEEILKMFEEMFGPKPTDIEDTQWIIEHLPEFLETYGGQKLFTVNRIITKQLSDVAVEKSSTTYRQGGYTWMITQGGDTRPGGSGVSTSMTLVSGPNTATAYAKLQNVYVETLSYDYKEEWVLEGLDKNYVIYTREIKGYIPGQENDGRNVLKSVVNYGQPTDTEVYSRTIIPVEPEPTDNIIGEGITTWINTQRGWWMNGVRYTQYAANPVTVQTVEETSTYRVD